MPTHAPNSPSRVRPLAVYKAPELGGGRGTLGEFPPGALAAAQGMADLIVARCVAGGRQSWIGRALPAIANPAIRGLRRPYHELSIWNPPCFASLKVDEHGGVQDITLITRSWEWSSKGSASLEWHQGPGELQAFLTDTGITGNPGDEGGAWLQKVEAQTMHLEALAQQLAEGAGPVDCQVLTRQYGLHRLI